MSHSLLVAPCLEKRGRLLTSDPLICPLSLVCFQLRSASLEKRAGLLTSDLSNGLERVPIPVFNETGNRVGLPQGLRYVNDYVFAEGVEELVRARRERLGGVGMVGHMH